MIKGLISAGVVVGILSWNPPQVSNSEVYGKTVQPSQDFSQSITSGPDLGLGWRNNQPAQFKYNMPDPTTVQSYANSSSSSSSSRSSSSSSRSGYYYNPPGLLWKVGAGRIPINTNTRRSGTTVHGYTGRGRRR